MSAFTLRLPIWFLNDRSRVTVDPQSGTATINQIGILTSSGHDRNAALFFTEEMLANRFADSCPIRPIVIALSTKQELEQFLTTHLPPELMHLVFDSEPVGDRSGKEIHRAELLNSIQHHSS